MALHTMARTIIQVTPEEATTEVAATTEGGIMAAATTEVDTTRTIYSLIMKAVIMTSSWRSMTCTTAAKSSVDS